ncbi:MAG: CHRD domain-containing protein [Candidatus Eremiobacteraeota bacterium]|nr:CHRD domain-containing protein [Candidatus Eremiobacteraeota bacterium]
MKAIIATAALGAALVFASTAPSGAQGTGGSPGKMGHHGGAMMMTRCHGGYVLNAVAGSGESGCATPHAVMGSIALAIKVKGEPAGAAQPSHIHRGKCGSNGPVVIPLTNVVNGMSSTTIPMAKWKTVNHGGYYINIHESADNIPHVVSCAEITAMAAHGAM